MKAFLIAVLLCSPALGAITRVAANCTGTSSCTTTGNAIGDLEIAYAGINASATAPSLATGWTSVGTSSINGTSTADSAVRMACKVATSTNEASNTFTNATSLIIMVYRGQTSGTTATCASAILGTPVFTASTVNTTTTTETFGAVTNFDSNSWDVGFGYCSACTSGIATAPAGMSNRNSITGPPGMGGHDTNGGVSSFASANVTLTTAGRIITGVVEIKAPCVNACHASSSFGHCGSGSGFDNMASCATVSSTTISYTATSAASGEVILIALGCSCASTTTNIGISGTGWTFNQIGTTIGTSANRLALYWAYVPNTSAATFTVTYSPDNGDFSLDLIDEFSGLDVNVPIDVSNSKAGSGSCSITVTPTVDNEILYGACEDTTTAVGTGFTKGADDTQNDWSEYQRLSGQKGVSQTVNFTGSGTYETFAVALTPPRPCSHFIALLGVGCT